MDHDKAETFGPEGPTAVIDQMTFEHPEANMWLGLAERFSLCSRSAAADGATVEIRRLIKKATAECMTQAARGIGVTP